LNDGNLANIHGHGDAPITQVDQAISVGFSHVDTAQAYRNEAEAGIAIPWSIVRGLVPHSPPRLAVRISTAQGLVKSIGVSNFEVGDLAILLASAKVKPVANQILLHPYVYARQLPILEYAAKHKIVIEAYSALIPITSLPEVLDAPLNAIAERLDVSADQVLLAWTKAKGASSSPLTEDDIAAIDAAGAKGPPLSPGKLFLRALRDWLLIGLFGIPKPRNRGR
ncbi:Aldo/keto reductase, partial [Mycena leptocephala]